MKLGLCWDNINYCLLLAVVGIVAPAVRKEEELKRKEEEDLQVLDRDGRIRIFLVMIFMC